VAAACLCFCRLFDSSVPAVKLFASRRFPPALTASQQRYIANTTTVVNTLGDFKFHVNLVRNFSFKPNLGLKPKLGRNLKWHWFSVLNLVYTQVLPLKLKVSSKLRSKFDFKPKLIWTIQFLPHDAMHTRGLCHHAVCVSVCLSHSCIVSKRIKVSSNFFTVGQPHHSSYSIPNGMAIFRREPP